METERQLVEVQRKYSRLQRDARRGEEAAAAELPTLTKRMGELRQTLEAARYLRTPPDKDIIGYATPTPITDGTHIWMLCCGVGCRLVGMGGGTAKY